MQLKELCAKYGESIHTITAQVRLGKLPAQKIKNRWHVNVSDYEVWKAGREEKTSNGSGTVNVRNANIA